MLSLMRRLILLIAMLFSCVAYAGRSLPLDMEVAILKSVDYPLITLAHDGISWTKALSLGLVDKTQTFNVSTGFRIRDERNRFIVKGRLYQEVGKPVAVKYQNGLLQELWVLSDYERKILKERARMLDRQGI